MSLWHRWRLYRYRLPLTRALTTGVDSHTRVGLILALTDAAGNTGYGEAAPLPGLHVETLPEIEAALIAALCEEAPAPPVARLAIEGAVLMLSAAAQSTRPARILSRDVADFVSFNALIAGTDPLGSAQAAAEAGHGVVKLKVGRGHPDDDLAVLTAIRSRFPALQVRLDANRAWSLPTAEAFCAEAARLGGVAYIEEPLSDPSRLSDLHRATGIPLALDESLPEGVVDFPEGVVALVIKPSVLSLTGAMQWSARARTQGMAAIISGAFESGVGRRVHLALAASLGYPAPISGLSTAGWLAEDVLDPPLVPINGRFALPHVAALRTDRLEVVAEG
ncbi:MAG: o-succinylbenzoate synthase [Myxococcota bacterium]